MVVFRQRMRAPNKQLPVDLDCISVHHTQCETQKCGVASCPFDPDPLPHPKCQLHPFNHFDIIRHTIGFEVHAEISSFRHLQAPKSYKDHRPFHQSIMYFRVVQVIKSLQDPMEVGNNLPGINDNVREQGLFLNVFKR